jgi:hypothetical protein
VSVERAAGVVLIVALLWFNATFALLGKRFDYPDILRRPTARRGVDRELEGELTDSEFARPGWGGDGTAATPLPLPEVKLVALPAALLVGPRGLEPRTCGLRVRPLAS